MYDLKVYDSIEELEKAIIALRNEWEVLKKTGSFPFTEPIEKKIKGLEKSVKSAKKKKNFELFAYLYKAGTEINLLRAGYFTKNMSVEAIIASAPSSDKLSTFNEYSSQLTDKEYWAILAYIYQLQDYNPVPQEILRGLFSANRKEKEWLMNEEEREEFESLPDNITIYRGMSKEEYDSQAFRLSWTLDKSIAEFFADRSTALYKTEHLVHELRVNKTDIIAYLNGRKEEEIIYIR